MLFFPPGGLAAWLVELGLLPAWQAGAELEAGLLAIGAQLLNCQFFYCGVWLAANLFLRFLFVVFYVPFVSLRSLFPHVFLLCFVRVVAYCLSFLLFMF